MKEILPYINVAAIIGLISLWLTFYKWKKSLHDDIVVPDIAIIKEEQKRQDARLDKLEKRCDEITSIIEEKFDAILQQQIEMTKELAVVTGKLEVIIKSKTK